MRQILMSISFALLCVASTAPARAQEPGSVSVDQLAWLAGHWVGAIGPARIEETWLAPRAGTMIGVNRTIADGVQTGFEFLRIADYDNGVVYLASPGGRCPPTPFRLIELADRRVVFANPGHDFPQRVIYRRDGDTLHGRIEGLENGRETGLDWQWQLEP